MNWMMWVRRQIVGEEPSADDRRAGGHVEFADQDGDHLSVMEVFGFGEPVLKIDVSQEGEESSMNLNREQAARLVEFLNRFIHQP